MLIFFFRLLDSYPQGIMWFIHITFWKYFSCFHFHSVFRVTKTLINTSFLTSLSCLSVHRLQNRDLVLIKNTLKQIKKIKIFNLAVFRPAFFTFELMKLSTRIKQLIYPLYILSRSNGIRKKKLNQLFNQYSEKAKAGIATHHQSYPLQLFSNMEEDGIILWIIASLRNKKGYFIDIGSNDCINSNCANLALNFGWKGIFIDSEQRLLNIGRKNYQLFCKNANYQFRFIQSFVRPENINQVIRENALTSEIDLISIDIDGNDHAIFKALDIVRPKCFIVENKIEFGNHELVIPPNINGDEAGASIISMVKLAESKGYTLIAANKAGFNTFFLRNDLVSEILPPIPVEAIINDPDVSRDFYSSEQIEPLLRRYKTSAV